MDERDVDMAMSLIGGMMEALERIADALEAANDADPVAMIQRSLTGADATTGAQGEPYDPSVLLDDETELSNIRAYVAALR